MVTYTTRTQFWMAKISRQRLLPRFVGGGGGYRGGGVTSLYRSSKKVLVYVGTCDMNAPRAPSQRLLFRGFYVFRITPQMQLKNNSFALYRRAGFGRGLGGRRDRFAGRPDLRKPFDVRGARLIIVACATAAEWAYAGTRVYLGGGAATMRRCKGRVSNCRALVASARRMCPFARRRRDCEMKGLSVAARRGSVRWAG